jgi:FkbM family methyltransferase
MLSTKQKLQIARAAYICISKLRNWNGKSLKDKQVICKRNGITWRLDLNEGIDFSIYLLGKFEPRTTKAIERLVMPGMTVIDIGANIGAHTLTLARCVGPTGLVIAVEPTDYAYSKLIQNLNLNVELRSVVKPIQAFLSDGRDAIQPTELYARWDLDFEKERHHLHLGTLCVAERATRFTLDELTEK